MTFIKFFDNPHLTHSGRVWRFGHHVSTDLIHPAVYFSLERERVMEGLFKGIDETIAQRLQPGDIILAGRNFGCGSSREVYATAMQEHGIAAVVVESAARIFYRNMINSGILVLEGVRLDFEPPPGSYLQEGTLTIDLKTQTLSMNNDGSLKMEDFPGDTLLSMLRQNSNQKTNPNPTEVKSP